MESEVVLQLLATLKKSFYLGKAGQAGATAEGLATQSRRSGGEAHGFGQRHASGDGEGEGAVVDVTGAGGINNRPYLEGGLVKYRSVLVAG
jgi:hypothetical protein